MIKLMKNSFYNEETTKAGLMEFISSADRFSMSQQCATFEANFSKWQGRQHAVFVMNGSMANLLLIQALLNMGRLKPGDKVGFSAVTWSTNVMPLLQLGLEPVPVDCELETLNVSSELLLKTLENDSLGALFITNALGFADDLEQIADICKERNIILIEDNCESLGSEINNKKLGNFGLASTFSTFVGHHMSTIEGGLICTDDEELHSHLVMCRAHGWDRNLKPQQQQILRSKVGVSDFYATYTFHELAFNARPTEIQGFLGNSQLQYLDKIIQKRAENFRKFKAAIQNDHIHELKTDHMSLISNFAMPVICKSEEIFQKYLIKFKEAEIEIRPVIAGDMTQQPFYLKHVNKKYVMPNANYIHNLGFYFPNHPDLTTEEVETIVDVLTTTVV